MLNNKTVIITGAASGIGRATAITFADRGANVVISDKNVTGLEETATAVEQAGAEFLSVVADISDEEDVKSLVSRTVRKFGTLDIACNNAGVGGALAATADYSTEEWDRVIGINLRGQWLCMKYEILAMLSNGGGSIVNVTSILGRVGLAGAPAYTAAKHGLEGLTKTAAIDYATRGIRVNAVAPAFIETPMLEKAGMTSDPEKKQSLINLHPIGRLGQSQEVADAIAWLASEEASFVTGQSLLVDGGYTAL